MTLPRPLALESPLLRAAGFRHGFSTRPLDFRPGNPELAHHEESLALLLRLRADRFYRVSQVHGSRAVVASGDPAALAKEQADAIVLAAGGSDDAAAVVRVADCVPVLLADSQSGAVAAVHAGWRGLVAGVIASAIEQGAAVGARFDLAAIGPCIEVCCFEVGEDVAAQIAGATGRGGVGGGAPDRERGATASERGGVGGGAPDHDNKPHVDLRAALRAQLVARGLQNAHIDDVRGCTRCDAELFFSHRRDGEASGRQVGVIATRA